MYWWVAGCCSKPFQRLVLTVTAPVCGESYKSFRSSRLVAQGFAEFRRGGAIVMWCLEFDDVECDVILECDVVC